MQAVNERVKYECFEFVVDVNQGTGEESIKYDSCHKILLSLTDIKLKRR